MVEEEDEEEEEEDEDWAYEEARDRKLDKW